MKSMVRALSVTAATLIGLGFATAEPADWPNRPIRIIVPGPAGGAADTLGRLILNRVTEDTGYKFVMDNRPGAGGLIGATAAAQAAPDGYTFVISSLAYHVVAPATSTSLKFDPLKDITHIAFFGGSPNVVVAHPSTGVKTLDGLIAYARKNPPLNYVSSGVGTLGHLMMEYFAEQAGMKVQHVPHKGAPQAMIDLIAGNVSVGATSWVSASAQIQAGKIVPIAISTQDRMRAFPNIPTLRESGYPDFVATTWFSLSGPPNVPGPMVTALNGAVRKATESPAVKAYFDKDGIEARSLTPEQFTAFVVAETKKWGPLAKQFLQKK